MPASGGSYGSKQVAGATATTLKRAPAGKRVSGYNMEQRPRRGDGNGRYAGLPKGPSGGTGGTSRKGA